MALTMNNKPAPPGVVTARRVFFLEQVSQGRVRWLIDAGEALWIPREAPPSVQTPIFVELLRSKWAYIEPWDETEKPPPTDTGTALTGEGWNVLIEARRKRSNRKTLKQAESSARNQVVDGFIKAARIFTGGAS